MLPRKLPVFSARVFLASKILISRQDLTWSLAEILGNVLATLTLRSRQKIVPRFLVSFWPLRFWDLAMISARISTRFWDLGENLGKFLAAEILRSHRDLSNLAGQKPRSRQSHQPKTCQDLSEILPRCRSKFCRGSHHIFMHTYCTESW